VSVRWEKKNRVWTQKVPHTRTLPRSDKGVKRTKMKKSIHPSVHPLTRATLVLSLVGCTNGWLHEWIHAKHAIYETKRACG